MEFHELLQQLREPGENGVPTDLADQLQAVYDQTVTSHTESAAALSEQITQEKSLREQAESAKAAAQAHNQRLLRSLPVDTGKQSQEPAPGDSGDDDKQITIDDLIEYK